MAEKRIFHIVDDDLATELNNRQIGVQESVDTEIGVRLWAGKDNAGNTTFFLGKDQYAKISALKVTALAGSGSGVLVHDDDGLVSSVSSLISGLSPTQVLFGAADGSVAQTPNLTWDDGLIGLASDSESTKRFELTWDGLTLGRGVTKGTGYVLNGAVLIGDESENLLNAAGAFELAVVMGVGNFSSISKSLIAAIGSYIGTGAGSLATPLADSLVCVGSALSVDAQYGEFIGFEIDSDGALYSRAIGQNLTVNHNYCDVQGRYAKSIFDGASFRASDRYGTVDGSIMTGHGLTLYAVSTGEETVYAKRVADGSDFTSPTSFPLQCPEGKMVSFRIRVHSSVVGSLGSGFRITERTYTMWNHTYSAAVGSDHEVLQDTASYWDLEIYLSRDGAVNQTSENVGYTVQLVVTDTNDNAELLHVILVTDIIVSETTYIASS